MYMKRCLCRVLRMFLPLALGGFAGLSCKPSVRSHDGKRDLALVLASDGLWDYVEEKEVGKLVTECSRQGLEHVAHRLVQEAVRSGSMDNISCLAVFL